MSFIIGNIGIFVTILAVIIILAIFASGYVKAPPDMAFVISGFRKKPRILVGKAGIKIPFFERLDKLPLGTIQIDVKTASSVPTLEYINIRVDSNVNVRVGQSPGMIELACQNFLNQNKSDIVSKVRDVLEGNVREIVGSMRLTEMVSDRKAFSEKVQENAVPDLRNFGLELVSFNVQNFADDNGVIDNLGIDNTEQIRKKAAIAKSDAQREIAIAEADNMRVANEAKVKAAEDIAIKNNDLEIKKAELKKASDTQRAQADMAMDIELENQRKIRDVAATDANIAKAEREAELKKQEIELRERELDAVVRKQADADKYKAEKAAEAAMIQRQRKAEADRYELEQKAEAEKFAAAQVAEARRAEADALKYAAMAEAEGIKAKGLAEAEGIRARGLAEAEAIDKKAEAQKKMSDASIIEMTMAALPQIVANAAAPLTNIDKITLYGSGDTTKLVSDVMNSTTQIMEGIKGATGLDISSLIAGYLGGKMNN